MLSRLTRLTKPGAQVRVFLFKLAYSLLCNSYDFLTGILCNSKIVQFPFQAIDMVFRPLSNGTLRLPVIGTFPFELRR